MEVISLEPTFRLSSERRSRKEVFQPHLPVRLPCYDLAPITSFTLGRSSRLRTSGTPGFHGFSGQNINRQNLGRYIRECYAILL